MNRAYTLRKRHFVRAAPALRPTPEPPPGPDSDWFERETASHRSDAEDVAKAGAGGLLVAVGLAEVIISGSAAAWWQQSAALMLAVAGFLALALVFTARVRRRAAAAPLERRSIEVAAAIGGRGTRAVPDVTPFAQAVHVVVRGG